MEKSLLTIDDNEHLGMHDLLQEMGKKIVCLKSGGNLGKQSRLWLSEDLLLCIGERYCKNNDKTLVLSQQISDIILFNKLVLKKKKKIQ